jgi:hypothetical protein
MRDLEDSFIFSISTSLDEQVHQTKESILLIQQCFRIQIEKLQIAYIAGTIDEKEYDEWFELFDSMGAKWLAGDLAKSENILFLPVVAKHNLEIAKN